MAQTQAGNKAVGWGVLVFAGAVGNAVGLIGKVPVVTLVAAPLAIIGVIGLMVSRRTQRS
ncbi:MULTISPECIES: hypothetical protein [unclassified Streptomyces]|uniref:hypothetical protein n=1 Tax=unclassified Streptomyces TaxID=2593676 RepID=UPI003D70BA35